MRVMWEQHNLIFHWNNFIISIILKWAGVVYDNGSASKLNLLLAYEQMQPRYHQRIAGIGHNTKAN